MLPVVIGREHEKAALKQARQAKDWKTVARLEERVKAQEIPDYLYLYYNAFIELDTERLFENGPIPASAIRHWCFDYDLSFSQFDIMRVVIRLVDNAVLTERAKKYGKPATDREADRYG